jgi:hypothetical protein
MLQRLIAEWLRPMLARFLEERGERAFVGVDPFIDWVEGRGFVPVFRWDGDRVYCDTLRCWLRAVGEVLETRLRIGVGPHGNELVLTERQREERGRSEKERAEQERQRAEQEQERERARRMELEAELKQLREALCAGMRTALLEQENHVAVAGLAMVFDKVRTLINAPTVNDPRRRRRGRLARAITLQREARPPRCYRGHPARWLR